MQQHEMQVLIHLSTGDMKKERMLTLGCLWFKTTANSRPSGEKADTKAPLDFTGWQGGVRWDITYVLVAHCMLYLSEL